VPNTKGGGGGGDEVGKENDDGGEGGAGGQDVLGVGSGRVVVGVAEGKIKGGGGGGGRWWVWVGSEERGERSAVANTSDEGVEWLGGREGLGPGPEGGVSIEVLGWGGVVWGAEDEGGPPGTNWEGPGKKETLL